MKTWHFYELGRFLVLNIKNISSFIVCKTNIINICIFKDKKRFYEKLYKVLLYILQMPSRLLDLKDRNKHKHTFYGKYVGHLSPKL